jgi:hypothetical protein
MKKLLGTLLGFEWVQNVMLKNAARAASVALLALAAKTSWAAPILSAFGITGDAMTGGLIAIGIAILGALRGWTKPMPPEVK